MDDKFREEYCIPDCYDGPYFLENRVFFTHLDSTITVYPDSKESFESHMGLNSNATSHEFTNTRR